MPANRIKIEPALERRYARQQARRQQRMIVFKILIVCEGTKTEPEYFKAFNGNRGTFVFDIDVEGIGANTTTVVDKAIELKDKALGTEHEYDSVWAVFDKDSFSKAKFNDAIFKAERNGIMCAWSNEAFELWYLYHFQNRVTPMSRDEYKKAISDAVNKSAWYKRKKKFEYAKNDPDNYRIMTTCGSQDSAIRYAEQGACQFNDECYADHNPCTMVYKLVRQLTFQDKEFVEKVMKNIKN